MESVKSNRDNVSIAGVLSSLKEIRASLEAINDIAEDNVFKLIGGELSDEVSGNKKEEGKKLSNTPLLFDIWEHIDDIVEVIRSIRSKEDRMSNIISQ